MHHGNSDKEIQGRSFALDPLLNRRRSEPPQGIDATNRRKDLALGSSASQSSPLAEASIATKTLILA